MFELTDTMVIDMRRVGMLRQWINEDRIINNREQKLITNEDILFWLTGDERFVLDNSEQVLGKKEDV